MYSKSILQLFEETAQKVAADKDLAWLSRDAKITSLGIDSVAMMEIIGEIEDELDVCIPDEKLARIQTVSDIEQAILELKQPS